MPIKLTVFEGTDRVHVMAFLPNGTETSPEQMDFITRTLKGAAKAIESRVLNRKDKQPKVFPAPSFDAVPNPFRDRVRAVVQQSKPPGEDPLCPRCGGDMALRTNKQEGSKFWGCRDYPNCRGTVNSFVDQARRNGERRDNPEAVGSSEPGVKIPF